MGRGRSRGCSNDSQKLAWVIMATHTVMRGLPLLEHGLRLITHKIDGSLGFDNKET